MNSQDIEIKYNMERRMYYIGFQMKKREATNFVNNICTQTNYGKLPYYALNGYNNSIEPKCNVVIACSEKEKLNEVHELLKKLFNL